MDAFVLARPGTTRPFAGGAFDRVNGRITQLQENGFCPGRVTLIESGECLFQRAQPEIGRASRTVDTIEECRQVDELRAGIHEIEVEHLLSRHEEKMNSCAGFINPDKQTAPARAGAVTVIAMVSAAIRRPHRNLCGPSPFVP